MIGAVDIGGTKIAVGMVDDTGRVLSKLESPTDAHRGYLNGLERIIGMLRETAQHAGVQISGIGIGSTGMVLPSSGAFGDVDFLPGWRGNNPVEDLARALNVTVALENDADASALGEASWGAGRGKPRFWRKRFFHRYRSHHLHGSCVLLGGNFRRGLRCSLAKSEEQSAIPHRRRL